MASAQQVHYPAAQKTATNFFTHHCTSDNQTKEAISLFSCKVDSGDTLYYIFNAGNNGFIILSAEYSVTPVLAFSTEGKFIDDPKQEALQYWLQGYSKQIQYAKTLSNKTIHPKWDMYLNETTEKTGSSNKNVSPLITTKWNQDNGFNYHCPAFPGAPADGKCYTGCVATAMAQIMKYYNYPAHGTGSHSYYHPYYTSISANFDTTNYNWSVMSTGVSISSREAISTLMYDCGVAVDMDYGPYESGSQTFLVPQAMIDYFNYRLTISYENKSSYEDKNWKQLLFDNLDQHHPILYSGSGSSGGHAWVCDGYQDTMFHFNWGWGGSNNGYFSVDSINSGNGDFTSSQGAVVNIMPYNAPYCMSSRTFTQPSKQIEDGSGNSSYWNNTQCGWLIQPAGADKVVLTFTNFQTESGKDFVNVYDGTSAATTLLGTYSGHNLPPVLTANSGAMYITFTSDSLNQDYGWDAHYSSVILGVNENNISESVVLYPVPAGNQINLILPSEIFGSAQLNIYNMTGQLMSSEKINLNGSTLSSDISSLSSGLYTIELNTAKFNIHKSFIK